jgi:hypothetical protein
LLKFMTILLKSEAVKNNLIICLTFKIRKLNDINFTAVISALIVFITIVSRTSHETNSYNPVWSINALPPIFFRFFSFSFNSFHCHCTLLTSDTKVDRKSSKF